MRPLAHGCDALLADLIALVLKDLGQLLDARAVGGVGGGELRRGAASGRCGGFGLVDPEAKRLDRVVAGALHVIYAEPVSLQLVLARIGQDHAVDHAGAQNARPGLGVLYAGAAQRDVGDPEPDAGGGLTAGAFGGVVARQVADLVAQDDFVTDAELDDIRAAAAAILAPQPADLLSLRITSVRMNADGEIYVDWSESETLPPLTDDTLPPLPDGLLSPMGSIVMTEAVYPYQSPFQKAVEGTITLTDTAYLRPRRSPWVRRPG